jgi:hypothetical protein
MSTSDTTIIHLPENSSAWNLLGRIQDNLENEGYEVSVGSNGTTFRSLNIQKNGQKIAHCVFSVVNNNTRPIVWDNKITVTWFVSSSESHPWLITKIRSAVR